MFVRDAELGGRGRQDGRARVLQQAKEQREARERLRGLETAARALQAFARGRLAARSARNQARADLRQKLADVARLKAVLQLPSMPIPFDVLFDLIRKLAFVYNGGAGDVALLAELSGLVKSSLDAAPDALKEMDRLREWQMQRFVDMSLQAQTLLDGAVVRAVLQTVEALVLAAPQLREYVVSDRMVVLSDSGEDAVERRLYAELPRASAIQIARRMFLRTRCPIPNPSYYSVSPFNMGLMRFVVGLLQSEPAIIDPFVAEILSLPLLHEAVSTEEMTSLFVPFTWMRLVHTTLDLSIFSLPTTPVVGISSETWLLGNILWISERVTNKNEELILTELELLIKLLQAVPPAAYAPNGVSLSWTKVSESHSMPIVFPESLNAQLRVLIKDQYIRGICDRLLSFNPSGLKRPLSTDRPVPMYPAAPTIAEQFGFGDIASSSSLSTSISITWQKVKSVGKATWAKLLLDKARSHRSREKDAESTRSARGSLLENKSQESRSLATNGSEDSSTTKKISRLSIAQQPFVLNNVYVVTKLCATFLFRWGGEGANRQSHAMRLLNTLSFYQVNLKSSDEGCQTNSRSISFVKLLWCVLQEVKPFEDFAKSTNLLRAQESDPYACTLALFCMCYDHLLLVLDDEEMYDQQFPLALCQVERVVLSLKRSLHSAYWMHANLDPDDTSGGIAFGMLVVDAATRLMRNLYNRCSRYPFCNVTSWVIPELDSKQLIEEVLAGTPRANKLIYSMPYLISFPDRVKLFQKIVAADKACHQGQDNSVYRIRIHRSAILVDGLKKLNSIRGNLKKRINVVFVNAAGREEVGIDAGGLFKEFWLDLSTLAFDLHYGLFLTTDEQLLYPNPNSASAHFSRESDHLTLFQFVGRILGKALYEGIVVQPKFAHFFLSKLLHNFNQLNDLPSLDPEIYKNLMFLKSYDGDVEDLGLTHTVVKEVFGEQREVEIIPGGANIPVTNHNKTRYIHLVANYYLNSQIREQCAAFRAGLSDLIDPRWLQMFNEPELQVLISGKSGKIDVDDLRTHTKYAGGYYAMDKRVAWFWQALASFSPSEQAAFLRFATSCQRAPSLGFEALNPPFCVQKIPIKRDDELLPSSSTCFNTLKLPTYSSYKVLRAKLLVSISSGAGFEMT